MDLHVMIYKTGPLMPSIKYYQATIFHEKRPVKITVSAESLNEAEETTKNTRDALFAGGVIISRPEIVYL